MHRSALHYLHCIHKVDESKTRNERVVWIEEKESLGTFLLLSVPRIFVVQTLKLTIDFHDELPPAYIQHIVHTHTVE